VAGLLNQKVYKRMVSAGGDFEATRSLFSGTLNFRGLGLIQESAAL
jgi:hydrogenase maturation factor